MQPPTTVEEKRTFEENVTNVALAPLMGLSKCAIRMDSDGCLRQL
ncbi:MAG: hypothetical protein R2788_03530 [Saprospiraceae bacterium]